MARLTGDGDFRSFVKDHDVNDVGSVGVLLAAINSEKVDETITD